MIVSAQSQTGDEVEAVQLEDGTIRHLGYTPSGKGMYAAPLFRTAVPLMDRKDWQQFDDRRPGVPILNQLQIGECVGEGPTRTLMLIRDASGQKFQLLSGASLYAQINGGRDNGADPSDAMTQIQSTGICLDSQLPDGHFYTKNDLTAAMLETASRFRVTQGQYYSCDSFDELGTAIQLRYYAFLTVRVAGNWQRLDANGSPPAFRGQGNHCMSCGEGFKVFPNGKPAILTAQSWGLDWGLNGYCYLTEDHFANQRDLQIYVVKAPVIDPQDPLAAWPGVG